MTAFRPVTLNEALAIRRTHGTVPLAGGTDLMAAAPSCSPGRGESSPSIMFIGHLTELRQIRMEQGEWRLGAAVTLADILDHARLPAPLRQAVADMASPAIRNVATAGGNICNASPCGDTLPFLYAQAARVLLCDSGNRRELPIERFIIGPGKTALRPDELLTEIVFPAREFVVHRHHKVGARRANTLAKLSFLGLADMDAAGRLSDIRLTFGSVAPTVIRAPQLEQRLCGLPLTEMKHHIDEISAAYDGLIQPIDDQRSTREYRKQVCLNLLRWFLEELIA
ncbi:MAG: FAD binding domain-containing protein [Acidobacteria bacterium]|nr:FAD binding domain-containing protein [Acidobacteriota bacterium]